MSNLIKPLSVKDTVLDISDSIDFAVFKSGQNVTSQKYNANSKSKSQHIYAIQVPSISTVVSRNIIWGSDITFTLTGNVTPYEYLWNGVPINQVNNAIPVQGADSFAPFVLHQLTNNINCQINNTSVVQNNVNQILDPILRGLDKQKIQELYGSTLTQLDYWGDYLTALPQSVANAGALAAAVDAGQKPLLQTWNSPFNTAEGQNTKDLDSRGSFEILSIVGNVAQGNAAGVKDVLITIRVREPLLLSPFLFGGDQEHSGLVGITQLNFTMSMDSTAKRALRWYQSQTALATKSVKDVSYDNSYMELVYYTPPPTFLVPATCVTPLQQMVNYILPAGGPLASGASFSLTSNSLQLNSIPDKVVIWIDDNNKQGATGNLVPDHYGTITGVNITFNNQTGILSNFSQKQLFDFSRKSGSQQTYDEFSGVVRVSGNAVTGANVPTSLRGTCGSVLYLNFGDCININEVYNAPGSLTTTQFVVQVNFTNNLLNAIVPQLNVMFLYSGILSTTNGNSSSYLNGVLTRNDVLNAAAAPHMSQRELVRYVGNGVFSDMKAMASNYLPMAKKLLQSADNKYAKLGAQALDTVGYGGGMSTAGISTAGRMASKMRM
jgi:hypothetical protein